MQLVDSSRCLFAAGTLLFVALLFAVFISGFLILGHLGFNSFYSFVFQPLELCVFGVSNLRSYNLGVQLASAVCLLCLGGYCTCGGLMIFLALTVVLGRLIVGSLSWSEALKDEGETTLTRCGTKRFMTSIVAQIVAVIGTLLVLCTTRHNGTDPLKRKVARAVLVLSFLAGLCELVLVIAQLVAYKFSSKWKAPWQRAAILVFGGYFHEPTSQVYIAGRHDVHYDEEAGLYSST